MSLSLRATSSPRRPASRSWTPLHSHMASRSMDEHLQLMHALQRAMAEASASSTLATNAKVRGLFDALVERRRVLENFIAQQTDLYGAAAALGAADGAFYRLRQQMLDMEAQVAVWDTAARSSEATKAAHRKHITFSPSSGTLTPSKTHRIALAAVSRVAHHSEPRSTAELMQTFEELTRLSERTTPVRRSTTPLGALRSSVSRSSTDSVGLRSARASHVNGAGFGDDEARIPLHPSATSPLVSSRGTPAVPSVHPYMGTLRPLGYLHDFSVESSEVKHRMAVVEEELIQRREVQVLRSLEIRSIVSGCPPPSFTPAAASVSAPPVEDFGETSDQGGFVERLVFARTRRERLRALTFATVAVLVLAAVISALLTLDEFLDAWRPYGRNRVQP